MKYQQPFDQPGTPNASYVNGNPATGTPGSIPPAKAFEDPQREIINFIEDSNFTQDDTDLHQISRSVQSSAVMSGIDTGTKNAMSVTLKPTPQTLNVGFSVSVKKIAEANDDAVTLTIVGLGTAAVHLANGAALTAGDLPASCVYEYVWDGSYWQTKNFQGISVSGGSTTNNYTLTIPYCEDTSGTPNSIIAPFSPVLTSLAAGDMIKIKLANTVTGATTATVNNLDPIQVVRPNGSSIQGGDIVSGQILILEYDGIKLQCMNLGGGSSSVVNNFNYTRGCIYIWPLDTAPEGTLECNGASLLREGTYAGLFAIIGTTYGAADSSHFFIPDYRGMFLRGWSHGSGMDPEASTRTNRGDGTTGDHVGTRQGAAVGNISFSSAPVDIRFIQVWARDYYSSTGWYIGGGGWSGPPQDPYDDSRDTYTQVLANGRLGGVGGAGSTSFGWDTGPVGRGSGGWGGATSDPVWGDVTFGPTVERITGRMSVSGDSGGVETRPININVMYVIAY